MPSSLAELSDFRSPNSNMYSYDSSLSQNYDRAISFTLRLVELGHVLENELAPRVAPCLDEQPALADLPQLDRCEAEPVDEGCHRGARRVVVAGEKHDPPAPLRGRRSLGQDACWQMVEG